MTSRLSFQWPIILSIFLHATIWGVAIVANVFQETEQPVRIAATTSFNVTLTASKAVLKKAEPVREEKQEPVVANKPKKVTTKKASPTLVKRAELEPDRIKERPQEKKVLKKAPLKEAIKEKQPEELIVEERVQKEQMLKPEQEFSKEAYVIQDQIIGQQLIQQTAKAEAQYQDQILSLIESNKFYPKRAKKMRQEGDVSVAFTLNRDGSIQNLKVLDETAPSLLKRAALKAIQLSALFPPFPNEFSRSTRTFETKLSYKLF
jgi:protein TonB